MVKLHEQVSGVSALDGVLDGAKRKRPARPRKAAAEAVPIAWSARCIRSECDFRNEDPVVMYRHVTKELAELQGLVESFRAQEELLAALQPQHQRARFTAKQIDFLRANQHMSMAELSEKLGRTPGAIKSMRNRMRRLEGESMWPTTWQARYGKKPMPRGTPKTLTPRDKAEILRLTQERQAGSEIARRMGISARTVYSVIRRSRSAAM